MCVDFRNMWSNGLWINLLYWVYDVGSVFIKEIFGWIVYWFVWSCFIFVMLIFIFYNKEIYEVVWLWDYVRMMIIFKNFIC